MSQQQALQWASQYLSAHNYIISDHEKIADTSHSLVYKIKTTKEALYLKQTPKAFAIRHGEAKLKANSPR